jgi:hypothetical protein
MTPTRFAPGNIAPTGVDHRSQVEQSGSSGLRKVHARNQTSLRPDSMIRTRLEAVEKGALADSNYDKGAPTSVGPGIYWPRADTGSMIATCHFGSLSYHVASIASLN